MLSKELLIKAATVGVTAFALVILQNIAGDEIIKFNLNGLVEKEV